MTIDQLQHCSPCLVSVSSWPMHLDAYRAAATTGRISGRDSRSPTLGSPLVSPGRAGFLDRAVLATVWAASMPWPETQKAARALLHAA
jgi:hypothetical protein